MSTSPEIDNKSGNLRWLENAIVIFCLVILVSVFQPFSSLIYRVGLGGVVFCALIFNLIPFLDGASSSRALIKPALIIFISFGIVTGIAILTALIFAATF